MSDDWRLRVTLADEAQAGELAELLHGGEVEHELDRGFADRVVVSVDGAELFAYAGLRRQADATARAIASLAAAHGWPAALELRRWHPIAERWEDPELPLPEGDSAAQAERDELIERERAESQAAGFPEWEVRIECGSHHDTAALAAKLRAEGLAVVRRWRFLVIGAGDERSAATLAERLRSEAPPGCTVAVEGSGAAAAAELPRRARGYFAVFGGLGG
jgi:hypothetical protein